MRRFERESMVCAMSHVAGGGQGLVLWFVDPPATFPGKVARAARPGGFRYAILYDNDTDRLMRTARRLGISRPVIDYGNVPVGKAKDVFLGEVDVSWSGYAFVKVYGKPLRAALAACREEVILGGYE